MLLISSETAISSYTGAGTEQKKGWIYPKLWSNQLRKMKWETGKKVEGECKGVNLMIG